MFRSQEAVRFDEDRRERWYVRRYKMNGDFRDRAARDRPSRVDTKRETAVR